LGLSEATLGVLIVVGIMTTGIEGTLEVLDT
jgi:hypothetical protein